MPAKARIQICIGLLFIIGALSTYGQQTSTPTTSTPTGSTPTTSTLTKTRNVFLIVSDGLRWQEIFTGAERDLLTTEHGGNWASTEKLTKQYWRETPEERRKAVFPFLWSVIATQGQIFGNQTKGSVARVTN